MSERVYKVHKAGQEESLFYKDILATDEDIVILYDATDENGKWLEEIWDEADAGFPDRNDDQFSTAADNYWTIDIPNVGRGILAQNASPIGIALKMYDALKLNIKFE